MQRTIAARATGRAWPDRAHQSRIRVGMSPGGRNAGSSGSMTGPPAGQRRGGTEDRVEVLGRARSVPGPHRLREQPQAHHVPQVPDACRPRRASFVKFAARPASVRIGASSSTPTRPQVPHEIHAAPSPSAGTATTAEAVSCDPTSVTGVAAAEAGRAGDGRQERPEALARLADRREEPARQAERVDQVPRPVAGRRVEQRGRRRVGPLGDALARQPGAEQVGDQQHRTVRRRTTGRRCAAASWNTVLNGRCWMPGAPVERVRGHDGRAPAPRRARSVRRGSGTGCRAARPRSSSSPKSTAHESIPMLAIAPPVDAPARRSPSRTAPYSAEHVPVEPVGQLDRVVREPVDLVEPQRAVADPPDDHPAARRAEVDRGDDARAHRRNAAATPASTGMWSPVVCDRSPPTSANTAAATCSGRTSFLRIVRWA